MAPLIKNIPEEVNVYSIPHFRMKVLVDRYFEMITKTNFEDLDAMVNLLETLVNTFREFKSHEFIENKYILKKLKYKMKCRKEDNSLVCKCHKESGLSEMLRFVKEGFKKKNSSEERIKYGKKLLTELESFTQTFIPHMREEEEVFQPLLLEYFTYEELRQLKSFIIDQHNLKSADLLLKVEVHADESSDNSSSSSSESETELDVIASSISRLPGEVLLQIFSFLSPKDLLRCASVSRSWNTLTHDYKLWSEIRPASWSQDLWHCNESTQYLFNLSKENTSIENSKEEKVHNFILTHLSSRVGTKVLSLSLAQCQLVNDALIKQYIFKFSNIRHLDLSLTNFSDTIFIMLNQLGLHLRLESLNVSGCPQVTDSSLRLFSHHQFDMEDYLLIGQLSRCLIRDSCRTCCLNSSLFDCGRRFADKTRFKDTARDGSVFEWVGESMSEKEELSNSLISEFVFFSREENKEVGCDRCDVKKRVEMVIPGCLESKSNLFCREANNTIVSQGLFTSLNCCSDCLKSESSSFKKENKENGIGLSNSFTDYNRGKNMKVVEMGRKGKERVNSELPTYKLKELNLSGCNAITDAGIRALVEFGSFKELKALDLSGCNLLTTKTFFLIQEKCAKLDPKQLFFCDNIVNTPFDYCANGCNNIESDTKFCCRNTVY